MAEIDKTLLRLLRPNFFGLFRSEKNIVSLRPGEILFKKSDPAQHMYVVLSGDLRVGDGDKFYEKASAGDMLGEMALIDRTPRTATVTAESKCTLAEIDEKRFLFLIQQTPNFALNVLRLMSQRLRQMNATAEI